MAAEVVTRYEQIFTQSYESQLLRPQRSRCAELTRRVDGQVGCVCVWLVCARPVEPRDDVSSQLQAPGRRTADGRWRNGGTADLVRNGQGLVWSGLDGPAQQQQAWATWKLKSSSCPPGFPQVVSRSPDLSWAVSDRRAPKTVSLFLGCSQLMPHQTGRQAAQHGLPGC